MPNRGKYDKDTRGQGGVAGLRACRGLSDGVGGDHRGVIPAGDERGDAAQVGPPGRG